MLEVHSCFRPRVLTFIQSCPRPRDVNVRGVTDESEILDFLEHGTLVGLLPQPHPILIRRYQSAPGPTVWFCLFIWSDIYLKSVISDHVVPPARHCERTHTEFARACVCTCTHRCSSWPLWFEWLFITLPCPPSARRHMVPPIWHGSNIKLFRVRAVDP